jgi:RNA polymerase sigma-70 factor, ECF subfamily
VTRGSCPEYATIHRETQLNPPDKARVSGTPRAFAAAPDPADLSLVELVRQKDRKATADLVALHADAVYAYLVHRLQPNITHAEDLTQEVFLSALRSIDGYRGASGIRQWLLGIARNKVQDHYRKSLKETGLEDTGTAGLSIDDDLPGRLDEERQRQRTTEVLRRMRQDYSVLLRWRYWEGKSTAEIAALIGKSDKAVERALTRARGQFSALWKEAR